MKPVYVVIVNWRQSAATMHCLQAVLAQRESRVRCIVVDNHSEDGSADRIRARYPEVVVLENSVNGGFSAGCNLGIRYALRHDCEFIWLINNDAIPAPEALCEMRAVMATSPTIGAVGAMLLENGQMMRGGGRVSYVWGRTFHALATGPVPRLDYLVGTSLLLRRDAIESVGGFDHQAFFLYWEDTDYGLRLRQHGWGLAVAEQAVVAHFGAGSLGRDHPDRAYHVSRSATIFFRRYARRPWIPIGVGLIGRVCKHLLVGRWRSVMPTVRGGVDGWHALITMTADSSVAVHHVGSS